MNPDFAQMLACPATGQALRIETLEVDSRNDIKKGWLHTEDGKHRYPIRNHIPRFVESSAYAKSFDYQRKAVSRVLFNEEHFTALPELFEKRYLLEPNTFRGENVLDVGCGVGRFTEMGRRWGARWSVGVDLSESVDVARQNIGPKLGVELVQADILRLPFKPGTFDIVFSIGVLHHTPDPENAFKALPPLLKKDGRITVGLYTENWGPGDKWWRFFTPFLPKPLLYGLALAAIPLYPVYRLPFIGRFLFRLFPIFMNGDPDQRVLNTFDWYSPRYQFYPQPDEIRRWFEECALSNIKNPFGGGHFHGVKL